MKFWFHVISQLFHLFFSIDEDSNSEGGIQSPPECAPPTPPASISVVNDVIKSESHDNIFRYVHFKILKVVAGKQNLWIIFSAPKFGSELKRRASDVSLPSSAANHRPASLNLTYSQRGAPGKEKSKKAVKAVKQRTIKFHEYKVRKIL